MKTTPEYQQGRQAYRDGKALEQNPYLNPDLLTGNRTGANEKVREWAKGWIDAHAEWAEGKQDENGSNQQTQTSVKSGVD